MIQVDILDSSVGEFDIFRILGVPLFLRVGNDVLHAAALGGVELGQLVHDGLFGGDHGGHFQLGDAAHVVEREHVERVGHRDEQFVLQAGHGDDLVVVSHFAREQFRDLDRDGDAGQVDRRGVEHPAHGNRHVLVAHVAFFEDELEQADAAFFLLLDELFHLPHAQQAVFDEGVGDAFTK